MTAWTVTQIERQLPPIAHTAMYNWHKYWARKTWNVIAMLLHSRAYPTLTIPLDAEVAGVHRERSDPAASLARRSSAG